LKAHNPITNLKTLLSDTPLHIEQRQNHNNGDHHSNSPSLQSAAINFEAVDEETGLS
jgi:hypothetical protein